MAEQKEKETQQKRSGIHLRHLNVAMILVAAVLTVALLFFTWQTSAGYYEMREATDKYIICQQAASNMQAGSDYLTEQVRSFVMTGNIVRVQNYFDEVSVTRRRDQAVEDVQQYLADTEAETYMKKALACSDELKELEIYAMRLTAEADGLDMAAFPEEIRNISLSDEDAALSREEKTQLAQEMMFNDNYELYKKQIETNVSLCVGQLVNTTRLDQQHSADHLVLVMRTQCILIGLLLITVLCIVFMTTFYIINPLRQNVTHIKKQEYLPMTGSYELQYLAETYNQMFRVNREQHALLSYEASHDALTGLFNRTAFERFRSGDAARGASLLLIDADKFKGINDTYGHAVGDRVLIKIAEAIRDAFRAEDYVCRIGGDEFAVIMVHSNRSMEALVIAKIERINARLKDTSDGLPVASVSVGAAFSDRENPTDDIFKDADKALYEVKYNPEKKGVAFY